MNLRKLIVDLQQSIVRNKIQKLNFGGCGFFAYFVANELDKYGIPYTIMVADNFNVGGMPIEEKKGNINMFLTNKTSIESDIVVVEHCWLEVEQDGCIFKFDSEHRNEEITHVWEKDADFLGSYTKEELKIALRYGSWNTLYSKQQNKKLRSLIRNSFQSIAILEKFVV